MAAELGWAWGEGTSRWCEAKGNEWWYRTMFGFLCEGRGMANKTYSICILPIAQALQILRTRLPSMVGKAGSKAAAAPKAAAAAKGAAKGAAKAAAKGASKAKQLATAPIAKAKPIGKKAPSPAGEPDPKKARRVMWDPMLDGSNSAFSSPATPLESPATFASPATPQTCSLSVPALMKMFEAAASKNGHRLSDVLKHAGLKDSPEEHGSSASTSAASAMTPPMALTDAESNLPGDDLLSDDDLVLESQVTLACWAGFLVACVIAWLFICLFVSDPSSRYLGCCY